MGKTLYLVLSHSIEQDYDDIEDTCQNIKYFDPEADIIVNHPSSNHPNVKLRYKMQEIDTSRHVFSVLVNFLKYLDNNELHFDHLCWYSANQYMIRDFKPKDQVNYVKFFNHPDWESVFTGKDFPNVVFGQPFEGIQVGTNSTRGKIYDPKNYYQELGIEIPMCHHWDLTTVTKEVVDLARKHVDRVCEVYPVGEYGCDRSMTFLGYMALLSKQSWEFPPLFYSSVNISSPSTHFCTVDQIIQKYNEQYSVVKRVGYKKGCHLRTFIRDNYMK